jgi:hypothetical protein
MFTLNGFKGIFASNSPKGQSGCRFKKLLGRSIGDERPKAWRMPLDLTDRLYSRRVIRISVAPDPGKIGSLR